MIIYLCGPINGCADSECKDWREEAKKIFPNTLDPMRRDYRGRENECISEIVEMDKIDVQRSDVILANCPKPSVGTSMEIFYAWSLFKCVVCIVPDKSKASPWLIYHSTAVFENMRDACEFIRLLKPKSYR